MEVVIADWAGLLLRWAHVMAGIAWIGTSFYFIWLDASLRPGAAAKEGVAGESWMVHGGGFYLAEKYTVAPERMPAELHWFKYEAYFTWLTGFALLAILYYWGADAYLIDPSVAALEPWQAVALSLASLAAGWLIYDLICRSPLGANTAYLAAAVFVLIVAAAWGYSQLFGGRAAFLHVGALIGTVMTANVFFIIIPNQKKVVADLIAGRAPEARLGLQAKQRSLHNNYLTLPVLLMMISNHYPLLYAGGRAWIVAAGVVVVGGLIRHFFNSHNAGVKDRSYPWLIPASTLGVALLVAFTAYRPASDAPGEAVAFAAVQPIIRAHCTACHALNPTDENFDAPPADMALEQPAQIRQNAQRIYAQAVLSDTMPLGNQTGMTDEERHLLGAWIEQGAPLD